MLFSAPQAPWCRVCSSCFPLTGRSVCLAGDQGSVTHNTWWPAADTGASLTSIPARLSNLLDLPRDAWCMLTSELSIEPSLHSAAASGASGARQLRGRDGGRVVAEWAENTDKVKTISTQWIFSLKVLKQIKAKLDFTQNLNVYSQSESFGKVGFENEWKSTLNVQEKWNMFLLNIQKRPFVSHFNCNIKQIYLI